MARYYLLALLNLALSWLAHGTVSPSEESQRTLLQHPKLFKAQDNEVVADEYIVVYEGELVDDHNLRHLGVASTASQRFQQHFPNVQILRESVSSNWIAAKLTESELLEVLVDDQVSFVEQNSLYVLSSRFEQASAPWGLDRTDQDELPLSSTYRYDYTGRGVDVYIVDTGVIEEHVDFNGHRAECLISFVDDLECGETTGHGTHVAGIVAGRISGVAKDARIKAIRVCDSLGTCSKVAILAALEWLASTTGKRVVNLSLEGDTSFVMENAVQNLDASGAVVIMAAGNKQRDACATLSGSSASITVGAMTELDARLDLSNWGSCVDIWAPGDRITSAMIDVLGSGIPPNSNYAEMIGTSQAAPHVAGVAALHLERGVAAEDIREVLVNQSIVDQLTDLRAGSHNRLLHMPVGLEPVDGTSLCPSSMWGRSCWVSHQCCAGQTCQGRGLQFFKFQGTCVDNPPERCLLRRSNGRRCRFDFQCCSDRCVSRRCV